MPNPDYSVGRIGKGKRLHVLVKDRWPLCHSIHRRGQTIPGAKFAQVTCQRCMKWSTWYHLWRQEVADEQRDQGEIAGN
jgi:hypothetical protein